MKKVMIKTDIFPGTAPKGSIFEICEFITTSEHEPPEPMVVISAKIGSAHFPLPLYFDEVQFI